MKWISLIGLLICGSVNAQSVICERYGALPGEPKQTFDRRCPGGYKEVGQVGGVSRSSGYIPDGLADRMLEEQRERNEYIRESLEQAIRPRSNQRANATNTTGFFESWNVVMHTPVGDLPARLTANNDCSMTLSSEDLGTSNITGVTRTRDSFYFRAEVNSEGQTLYLNYSGRVRNNQLTGEYSTSYGSFAMNGTRTVGTGAIPSRCLTAETTTEALAPQKENKERASNLVEDLTNLSELHSQGILTDEEFNAGKRRLLGL